jgi:hypothetical protein
MYFLPSWPRMGKFLIERHELPRILLDVLQLTDDKQLFILCVLKFCNYLLRSQ